MSKSVTLDARKVIKYINDSAQSNIHTIEEALKKLGNKTGRDYKLVALHQKNLMFEDKNGRYYIADYSKSKGNRINLTNINAISIKESKKSHVFNNACVELVESIAKGDERATDSAFRKLESCRFRSTVTDNDGYVNTKDGERRRLVGESVAISKDSTSAILEAISRVMKEDVIIEGEEVVGARIGDVELKLPVTETMRRCNIAKKMKLCAEDAWNSPKFRKFVGNIAAKISKNMIKEAVAEAGRFLKEYQEFSLLNDQETKVLVENAMAMEAQFNPILTDNVSQLIHKTGIRANKKDIIEAWDRTARVACDSALLESVYQLSNSENFEEDYKQFLHDTIVEGTELSKDNAMKFLLTVKQLVDNTIESIGDSEELSSVSDDTVEAVNQVLGDGEVDVIEQEGEESEEDEGVFGESVNRTINEDDNAFLSKLKRASEEIEKMIQGVDQGDPDQLEAANNLINAIDVESLQASDTLDTMGQEPEYGDMEAGDIADATEGEEDEEGEVDLDLGDEEGGGLGDLGGDLGDLGDLGEEGEGEGIPGLEGLGGEEEGELDLGMGEEGGEEEGGEEDIEKLLAADINKTDEPISEDAYGDYAPSEEQEIDNDYGIGGEELSEAAEGIVSDLRNLFESENPFADGGPADKEETEPINEKGDEEDEEDGMPQEVKDKIKNEGAENIKQKNVVDGDEGVKAEPGAAEDSMPKDNGGSIPGGTKVTKKGDCCPTQEPGNKGSDSDMKDMGNPLGKKQKNDPKSATLTESKKVTKPTFNKGPFKKVK